MDINSTSVFNDQPQRNLPNATAVLVLGIVSLLLCCCYGGGVITSIIALILASKDLKAYAAAPMAYTVSSYKNLKTGRICAIISLVLNILCIIFMIIVISMVGIAGLSDPESMREILNQ